MASEEGHARSESHDGARTEPRTETPADKDSSAPAGEGRASETKGALHLGQGQGVAGASEDMDGPAREPSRWLLTTPACGEDVRVRARVRVRVAGATRPHGRRGGGERGGRGAEAATVAECDRL